MHDFVFLCTFFSAGVCTEATTTMASHGPKNQIDDDTQLHKAGGCGSCMCKKDGSLNVSDIGVSPILIGRIG